MTGHHNKTGSSKHRRQTQRDAGFTQRSDYTRLYTGRDDTEQRDHRINTVVIHNQIKSKSAKTKNTGQRP